MPGGIRTSSITTSNGWPSSAASRAASIAASPWLQATTSNFGVPTMVSSDSNQFQLRSYPEPAPVWSVLFRRMHPCSRREYSRRRLRSVLECNLDCVARSPSYLLMLQVAAHETPHRCPDPCSQPESCRPYRRERWHTSAVPGHSGCHLWSSSLVEKSFSPACSSKPHPVSLIVTRTIGWFSAFAGLALRRIRPDRCSLRCIDS